MRRSQYAQITVSEPLLNVMKVMLLCGLYLFFLRVLWSVFSELRDPRSVARKRDQRRKAAAQPRAGAPAASPAPRAGQANPVAPAAASVYATAGAAAPMATSAQAGPSAAGQLMVIDPPELAGHRYSLGNEVTLGRAHTNGIVLDDTYVSTVHARIFLTNGTYFIEDLASRNGSMINDQQLVVTTALTPGDRLQLGATAMEFS